MSIFSTKLLYHENIIAGDLKRKPKKNSINCYLNLNSCHYGVNFHSI